MRLGYACQRQPCLRKKICRRKNIPQQSTGRKGSDQNILLSNKNRGNKNKTQVYRHLNPNHSSFIKRTLVQFQNFLLQMEVSQMHPVSGCGGCAQTRIHHRDHHSKTHVSKRSIRTFVPRSPFPSVDDKPSFFSFSTALASSFLAWAGYLIAGISTRAGIFSPIQLIGFLKLRPTIHSLGGKISRKTRHEFL